MRADRVLGARRRRAAARRSATCARPVRSTMCCVSRAPARAPIPTATSPAFSHASIAACTPGPSGSCSATRSPGAYAAASVAAMPRRRRRRTRATSSRRPTPPRRTRARPDHAPHCARRRRRWCRVRSRPAQQAEMIEREIAEVDVGRAARNGDDRGTRSTASRTTSQNSPGSFCGVRTRVALRATATNRDVRPRRSARSGQRLRCRPAKPVSSSNSRRPRPQRPRPARRVRLGARRGCGPVRAGAGGRARPRPRRRDREHRDGLARPPKMSHSARAPSASVVATVHDRQIARRPGLLVEQRPRFHHAEMLPGPVASYVPTSKSTRRATGSTPATVTATACPNARCDASTGATTAGCRSCTTTPCLFRSTTTPSNVRRHGPRAPRTRPRRRPRARSRASRRFAASIVVTSTVEGGARPFGRIAAGAVREHDLVGVAVGESPQRGGDVRVGSRDAGVDRDRRSATPCSSRRASRSPRRAARARPGSGTRRASGSLRSSVAHDVAPPPLPAATRHRARVRCGEGDRAATVAAAGASAGCRRPRRPSAWPLPCR